MTAAFAFNQETGDYEIMPERVLCFPAQYLDCHLASFANNGGILKSQASVEGIFENGVLKYYPFEFRVRDEVENDPSWKQLIPYVVLTKGGSVFRYRRAKKGGENRLHGKYSIGVGGHINDGDQLDSKTNNPYFIGMARELEEEVGLKTDFQLHSLADALIYDDSNAVGRVHFGVVHVIEVPDDFFPHAKDESMADGHFLPVQHLTNASDHYENWSALLLPHLKSRVVLA